MELDNVQEMLIEGIVENQQFNGIDHPGIDSETFPIGDLENFDSLTAAEVITQLEVKLESMLDKPLSLDVSVFYTDKGKKALKKSLTHRSLSINDIANIIFDKIFP